MENLSQLETLLRNLSIDPTFEIYETTTRVDSYGPTWFGLAGIRENGQWIGSAEI